MDIGWVWEFVQTVAVCYGGLALWQNFKQNLLEAKREQDASRSKSNREVSALVRRQTQQIERLSEHIRSPMHRR